MWEGAGRRRATSRPVEEHRIASHQRNRWAASVPCHLDPRPGIGMLTVSQTESATGDEHTKGTWSRGMTWSSTFVLLKNIMSRSLALLRGRLKGNSSLTGRRIVVPFILATRRHMFKALGPTAGRQHRYPVTSREMQSAVNSQQPAKLIRSQSVSQSVRQSVSPSG